MAVAGKMSRNSGVNFESSNEAVPKCRSVEMKHGEWIDTCETTFTLLQFLH